MEKTVKPKGWTGKATSIVPLPLDLYAAVYHTTGWTQALDGRALSASHSGIVYIRTMWHYHDGRPVAMYWQPSMKTTQQDEHGYCEAAVEPVRTGRWGSEP
jgi:hypothetical protein